MNPYLLKESENFLKLTRSKLPKQKYRTSQNKKIIKECSILNKKTESLLLENLINSDIIFSGDIEISIIPSFYENAYTYVESVLDIASDETIGRAPAPISSIIRFILMSAKLLNIQATQVINSPTDIIIETATREPIKIEITSSLYNTLTTRELNALIAHEVGHWTKGSVFFWAASIFTRAIGIIVFLYYIIIRGIIKSINKLKNKEPEVSVINFFKNILLGFLSLLLFIFGANIFMSIAENRADSYAAEIGLGEELAEVLTRITPMSFIDRDHSNKITNIVNDFISRVKFNYPSLPSRINNLLTTKVDPFFESEIITSVSEIEELTFQLEYNFNSIVDLNSIQESKIMEFFEPTMLKLLTNLNTVVSRLRPLPQKIY